MTHVMVLARDTPGLLRRIVGLFERCGYDVRSFSTGIGGRTDGIAAAPEAIRISMTLTEPWERAERLARQLRRLADVLAVEVAAQEQAVARELALIKVFTEPGQRPEVLQVAHVFRARVVDAAPRSVVLEATGDPEKIDALVALLRDYGVIEVARGGTVALTRGEGGIETSGDQPPSTATGPALSQPHSAVAG